MKLSLTHYDQTISIEVERDDLNLDETVGLFVSVLVGAGFTPECVRDLLGEPYTESSSALRSTFPSSARS